MPNTPNSVLALDQFGNIPPPIKIAGAQIIAPISSALIQGVTDGSNATAGFVGEFLQAVQEPSGGGLGVNVSSGTPAAVTSITLTPGDWDVWGMAGTNTISFIVSNLSAGISTSPTGFGDGPTTTAFIGFSSGLMASSRITTPIVRLNVTTNTAAYIVIQANFSGGGTINVDGSISARRVR